MTIQQATQYINTALQKIYTSHESQNICNLLLEDITSLNRTQRIVNNNLNLTATQYKKIESSLNLLLQHKPIQQILGYTWFYNNQFLVDENVLIPRPETEELVDIIVKENINKNISIIDIGTGSGCIAISLKKALFNATITAIDISTKALDIAKQNAINNNVNINFMEMNFLDENSWNALLQYDIIVSNPPYITIAEKTEMKENVLHYEPHVALFTPPNNPLIFYEKIAAFTQNHLLQQGKIYMEINETLSKQTAQKFIDKKFNALLIKDLQEKDRIVKVYTN